ncbi:MAG: hypothetical protein K6T86_04070 [Pirellulales bacterium]|nr:hypothetical protein [Pirellulales bacterium]
MCCRSGAGSWRLGCLPCPERTYGFTAAVERAYGLLRGKRAHTLVEGEVVLSFDRFGRVLHAMEHVSRCVER